MKPTRTTLPHRILFYSILAVLGAYLVYNSIAFPAEWREVQPGMTVSRLDALCGPPDYPDGVNKPDLWIVTQPFGKWELRVGHAEGVWDRNTSVVSDVLVQYRPFWSDGSRYPVYWK